MSGSCLAFGSMTCVLGPSRRQGVQGPAADMNNLHAIRRRLQACVNIVSIADCGPHLTYSYSGMVPQMWHFQMYATRLVEHMPQAACRDVKPSWWGYVSLNHATHCQCFGHIIGRSWTIYRWECIFNFKIYCLLNCFKLTTLFKTLS